MTLGEFLHPLGRASQRDLVLATMYFIKRYEDKESVTTADIKAAFTRAKHTTGKKIAHASVLNQAAPFVESRGKEERRILWSLTDSGEKRVRELLDLPAAEPEVEHDVGTLQKLSDAIEDESVRNYVDEAILSLQVGALRAAVVFLWTGAVVSLQDKVWMHGPPAVDAALKAHNPKARDFKKKEDFAYVRDAELLQIAQDLAELDKSQKTLLGHALDLRNQCGHPVKYRPGVKKASAFIEDVIGIVWK